VKKRLTSARRVIANAPEDPWATVTIPDKYLSSQEPPEVETWSEKNWTSFAHWTVRVTIDMVAKEEGISVQDVQARFVRLAKLIQLDITELEGIMKVSGIMRLAVRAPDDISRRVVELKTLLPSMDVPKLVARCPALLVAETSLAELKAKLDAAHVCTDGVPRTLLERLMVTAPHVFLMGDPVPGSEPANGKHHHGGDSLVCVCCRAARRSFGCESDLQAVQKMIKTPGFVYSVLNFIRLTAA